LAGKATDVAGNTTTTLEQPTIVVDATAPRAPTIALATDSGSSNSDNLTNDAALTVSAAAADVSRSYSVDGGPAAATYTAPTTEGSHTVVVTDLDTAGNTASASLTFTLDTTAPGAPAVALVSDTGSSGSDKITNNGALSVTGVESGASVQYSTNGGTTWSSSFTAVEGANAVQVRQVDVAGNPTATPTSFSFTLDTTVP